MANKHRSLIEQKHEDWVPPPDGTEAVIVMPAETNPLPRYLRGYDDDNALCYRVIPSRWWQHYHWKIKNGSWLHCRVKFGYESHIKYACTPDGEYKSRAVTWYSNYIEALNNSVKSVDRE